MRTNLINQSLFSASAKIIEAGVGVAIAVLLARFLGIEGFGTYSLVFSAVALAALPTQMGLPTVVLRETAKGMAIGDFGSVRGLWRWALCAALSLGGSIAVIGLFTVLIADFSNSQLQRTALIGLAFPALISLVAILGAMLRGLDSIRGGLFVTYITQPVGFLALLLATYNYMGGIKSPESAMLMAVVSALVAVTLGSAFIRSISTQRLPAATPIYKARYWLSSTWPMAITQGAYQLSRHTDIIMLGILSAVIDAGIYRVAAQGVMLIALGQVAVDLVVSPRIASEFAKGNQATLKSLTRHASRIALTMACTAMLVLSVYGEQLISWLFGAQFASAWIPLLILGSGHLLAIGFGPAGPLLTMSGNERLVTAVVTTGALTNIILNLVLIPIFGIIGASIATASSLLLSRVFLWIVAFRRLGLSPAIF